MTSADFCGFVVIARQRLAPQTFTIKNIIFQTYTPLIYSRVSPDSYRALACSATLPLTLSLISSFWVVKPVICP